MPPDVDSDPSAEAAEWWHKPFSVFQTNLQDVDAAMDVEAALDVIEGYGADTWLINVGGIFSFYPSNLAFQTRGPLLSDRPSGDLIGDAVAAAKGRGIRVLARCDFSKVSSKIALEHPEWLFSSREGYPQVFNSLYSTCPSGEYYQEKLLEVIDEILSRYDVAGFFFNLFKFPEVDYARVYHGVCHCASCRAGFEQFSGLTELPDGPEHPSFSIWKRFCGDVIEKLNEKINAHIRERWPGVALILKRGAPMFYYEANSSFSEDFWPFATSEGVSAHRVGWPDVGVMVNCVSFVDMPYRMAGVQPEHFAQYQLQAMARGGNLSTYIMGGPDRIQYPALRVGREINRFYRDNYHVYEGLISAATIGLLRPDPIGMSADESRDSVEEFRGFYEALVDKGLPFDVLDATAFAAKNVSSLERYRLIIVPNAGGLGPSLANLLDTFVLGGGHVLLTGTSAVTERGEVEMKTAPALMRNGSPVRGQDLWSSYVTESVQSTPADFTYSDRFLPVFGSFSRYVWRPKTEKLGAFVPQAPYGPPEKCYGHEATSFPASARLWNQGVVVQIPWSVGKTFWEFGTSELHDHMMETILPLAQPLVTANIPGATEHILGQVGNSLVVHIINQTGEKRRTFGPHVALGGGSLKVSKRVASAKALVTGKTLEFIRNGDGTDCVLLPELGLFEVVLIQLTPQ